MVTGEVREWGLDVPLTRVISESGARKKSLTSFLSCSRIGLAGTTRPLFMIMTVGWSIDAVGSVAWVVYRFGFGDEEG
jgi:hypothetical protein